jgi:hypothetical protein
MADTRGVFTLDRAFTRSKKGTWVSPEQAFFAGSTATPNVGYVAGGSTAPTVSSVDKMSLADDTTAQAPSANLSAVNRSLMGLGNGSNAYWCGGRYGGPAAFYSGVEKLSYFSDTISRSPASNLPATQADASGTSNELGGYIAGGSTPTNVTTVNKLIFSTDTCFRFPSANLISAENGAGAVGNLSNCYIGGGESPINSTVDKIVFATDTTTRISATVASLRSVAGASGDSAGYFGGGNDGGPVSTRFKSTVVKFTFADETTSTLPSANSLRNSMSATQGVANSSAGYFAGGSGSPSPSHFSNVTKISFSNDTASNVPSGGNLSATRYNAGSASARASNFPTTGFLDNTQNLKENPTANIGYTFQGSVPGNAGTSYLHKLDYSTDALGVVPSGNLTASKYHNKTRTSPTAAYTTGGIPGSPISTTNKTTYSTETSAAVPSADTTVPVWGMAASSNTRDGYNYGGLGPGPAVTTVDKINFAADTLSRIPGANLPQECRLFQATGNPSRAYLGGGGPGSGTISSFDRIFYSSETTNRVPSANFASERRSMSAAGNDQSGYYSGFATPGPQQSTTSRLSYATDSVSDVPSAALSAARAYGGGTGNLSNGYNFSGYISPTRYTLTERINYTTDTIVQIPSANFPVPIYAMAGASVKDNDYPQKRPETPTPTTLFPNAPNTGYWVGGEAPRVSNVDKIEYASETVSRSPYGLPELRNGFDGTGDTEKAFYLGGFNPSGPGATSNVQKLVYATDVWSSAPNLNERRYFAAVTGDLNKGYTSGGAVPATSSRTERITFSTEATALVPGANLSAARYSMGNVSNQTSGYALGGAESGVTFSRVDKMTFSSETFAYTPGANLSVAKGLVAATGNASVALLIAGATPASKVSDADKLTFSTDTTSAVPSANLPTATGNSSGCMTGNGLNGYFAGGNDGSGTTAVYKVSFSTETTQYSPGRLSFARWNLASSSALESNQVTGVAPIL